MLLEDALILGDVAAAVSLFDEEGVLAFENQPPVRRRDRIAAAIASRDRPTFVPSASTVIEVGGLALVAGGATHVLRRTEVGLWRYVISTWPAIDEREGVRHA